MRAFWCYVHDCEGFSAYATRFLDRQMPPRAPSTLVLPWVLLAAAVFALLRETYWGFVVDFSIEHLSSLVGIEKAKLLGLAAPWLLVASTAAIGIYISFQVGQRERQLRSPLEVCFDINDKRYVEPVPLTKASRYYLDVRNCTQNVTVSDVEVEWDSTPFTRFIDGQIRRTQLLSPTTIDPQERIRVYLFGVDDDVIETPQDMDVLGHASRFTVRARGRDAKEVVATFQYSPLRVPKLVRVST
jgi:hypothetical protein